jgi:hypothetical protein
MSTAATLPQFQFATAVKLIVSINIVADTAISTLRPVAPLQVRTNYCWSRIQPDGNSRRAEVTSYVKLTSSRSRAYLGMSEAYGVSSGTLTSSLADTNCDAVTILRMLYMFPVMTLVAS